MTLVAPPSNHLGVARLPRPECEVCRRKPATAEAAPDHATGVYDPRAVVRSCNDGDCRAIAAARVQARLDEIAGRTSSVPPCRLQTGFYVAARGGR